MISLAFKGEIELLFQLYTSFEFLQPSVPGSSSKVFERVPTIIHSHQVHTVVKFPQLPGSRSCHIPAVVRFSLSSGSYRSCKILHVHQVSWCNGRMWDFLITSAQTCAPVLRQRLWCVKRITNLCFLISKGTALRIAISGVKKDLRGGTIFLQVYNRLIESTGVSHRKF